MKGTGLQLNDSTNDGEIMDLKIDVVRNTGGKIIKGLVIGQTLQQNKALLLISQQGEVKFRPDLGVGIVDIVESSEYLEYRHKIREQMAKDGMSIKRVDLYEGLPFEIDAIYES